MKITKRQLRKIIREEKQKLQEQGRLHAIFDTNSLTDRLFDEVEDYLMTNDLPSLSKSETRRFREATMAALENVIMELGAQ